MLLQRADHYFSLDIFQRLNRWEKNLVQNSSLQGPRPGRSPAQEVSPPIPRRAISARNAEVVAQTSYDASAPEGESTSLPTCLQRRRWRIRSTSRWVTENPIFTTGKSWIVEVDDNE